jgi:hypothetical protein
MRNASNDLTFDSIESPVDISTPWILSVSISSPITKKKKAISTA